MADADRLLAQFLADTPEARDHIRYEPTPDGPEALLQGPAYAQWLGWCLYRGHITPAQACRALAHAVQAMEGQVR